MLDQEPDVQKAAQFRACAGDDQGVGATPGEALNDLMRRISGMPATPIVTWPYNRGDAYFTERQQQRLNALKANRTNLTEAEQEEMERLVEAAFDATIARTQTIRNNIV